MRRSRILKFRNSKAQSLNYARRVKSKIRSKRSCEKKSSFGRKSTKQSNQSTNFTKILQKRPSARTSCSKWQLVAYSSNMIAFSKSTKPRRMSLNLSNSSTIRLRGFKKAVKRKMKMMQVLS